jgi:hypothetical protein
MPQVRLDMSLDETRDLPFPLLGQNLLALVDAMQERAETVAITDATQRPSTEKCIA